MTLPGIPEEALHAGGGALAQRFASLIAAETEAALVLTAAWPHLYAAALGHAADEMTSALGLMHDPCGHLNRLRRMADEATP